MRSSLILPVSALALLLGATGVSFAQESAQRDAVLRDACRVQAVNNGLSGPAEDSAIKDCVASAGLTQPAHSIAACRDEAIALNISSDRLHQFLENCTRGS